MSSRESGRVKWWRKKARDKTLPPVLLWWFSGLRAYFVLDGHDRLLAAFLEGKGVDVLCLTHVDVVDTAKDETASMEARVAEFEDRIPAELIAKQRGVNANQISVNRANRQLLEEHAPQIHMEPSRADGGLDICEWQEQVRHVCGKYKIQDDYFWESLLKDLPI